MEIDPLIRELGHDETSGTADLVEQGAKILIAFSGGYPADDSEQFSRGLVEIGRKILEARPNMAPLFHLVTELYALAVEPVGLDKVRRAIRAAAVDFTRTFAARNEKVSRNGAELFGTAARVLTVGRSDVVETALLLAVDRGAFAGAVIGEGRPAFSGRRLATVLAERAALNLRLVPDLALVGYLSDVDLILVGSSAIRAEGAVTPAGTAGLLAAARASEKPAYLLSGVMSLLPGGAFLPAPHGSGDPQTVWEDPPPGVTVENRLFDVTPLTAFRGIVMENGTVSAHEVEGRVTTMPLPPWVGRSPSRS